MCSGLLQILLLGKSLEIGRDGRLVVANYIQLWCSKKKVIRQIECIPKCQLSFVPVQNLRDLSILSYCMCILHLQRLVTSFYLQLSTTSFIFSFPCILMLNPHLIHPAIPYLTRNIARDECLSIIFDESNEQMTILILAKGLSFRPLRTLTFFSRS